MEYKYKFLLSWIITILVVIMCIFAFYNTSQEYIEKESFCEEYCTNATDVSTECYKLNCELIGSQHYFALLIVPLIFAFGYVAITIWANIQWVMEIKDVQKNEYML